MLVRKIIDAGPSLVLANGTANFSATLPNETPSCFSKPICPSKIGPGPVIPARARIAKAALYVVSQRNGSNQFGAARAYTFRHRQCSRNIIARMRWLFRQISIVIVEIADAAAVGER